jgi:hypothetical protein
MNFLLQHLLNYFLFAGTMMFAAGAVADVGTQDDGAQADAGGAGSGGDASQVDDRGDAGAADQGDQGDGADKSGVGADDAANADGSAADASKLDARTLPPSVKATLAELQAKDPKAHAWLKDRLWAEKRFRDEVPGGLEEVKQLRSTVGGLKELVGPQHANSTPEQIISAVKAEVSEWRAVDAMLDKGDANVLATIAEQFPDGFKKLLPLAVNEFAARDLPGFQKWGAQMIDGELQTGNIFGRLAFIDRLLAKNDVEGVKAELKGITDFFSQYKTIAAKKIEEAAPDPKAATREKELDSREHQLWVQESAGPINREKTSLVKAAVQQYIPKGETLDEETLAAIEVHVNRFLDPLLQADPNFGPTFKTFEQNRDAEGMKKFLLAKVKELLPSKNVQGKAVMGPAEKAVRLFFRQAPKPGPKPGAGQPGNKGGQQSPAPKGWIKIAADKAPQPHEIDKAQTSFEMSFAKAAILKDGRKVFWGDKAPA